MPLGELVYTCHGDHRQKVKSKSEMRNVAIISFALHVMLYVPRAILKKGANMMLVMELEVSPCSIASQCYVTHVGAFHNIRTSNHGSMDEFQGVHEDQIICYTRYICYTTLSLFPTRGFSLKEIKGIS